jgi:hypothetical protein
LLFLLRFGLEFDNLKLAAESLILSCSFLDGFFLKSWGFNFNMRLEIYTRFGFTDLLWLWLRWLGFQGQQLNGIALLGCIGVEALDGFVSGLPELFGCVGFLLCGGSLALNLCAESVLDFFYNALSLRWRWHYPFDRRAVIRGLNFLGAFY